MKHDPLISLALQPIPYYFVNATVNAFVNDRGGWRWSNFENLLPSCILMQIVSVMPHVPRLGPDRDYWCFDPRGLFTVRSVYASICHQNNHTQDQVWTLPWSWKGP